MSDSFPTSILRRSSRQMRHAAVKKNLSRVLLVMGIAAIIPASLEGRQPAEPTAASETELKLKVQQLVEQLDSRLFQERRSAERELLQLGPKILPFLPPPELAPSISVREAVRRIRVRLEHQNARESVRPSRVTLQKTLSLAELFKKISAQTGNRIDVEELQKTSLEQAVEVRFREREFWPAIDELASRTNFRIAEESASGALKLLPVSGESAFREAAVTYSGPFRIAVKDVALKPLRGEQQFRLLRIELGMTAEPRLRPLFVRYSGTDVTASTTEGPLPPFSPDARYELPLGESGKSVRLQADFRVPAAKELKQVALRGRLNVQTAAGSERFSFANLHNRKRQSLRKGGVTVILRDVEFQTARDATHKADVHVAVSYDAGGPAFESHRTWMFHNRVALETADGTRIEPAGPFSTELQADGAVAVGYTFENLKEAPSAYRFVYDAPTLILNVPVEFEMKDIPVTAP